MIEITLDLTSLFFLLLSSISNNCFLILSGLPIKFFQRVLL